MSPELRACVDDGYRVFAGYTLGGKLIACHCDVCMTEATALELARTPLREMPAALLAEYTNSAHDWDDNTARQLRYFLPRYFELIAANDPPDNLGLAVCLRRLGYAEWRTAWPAEESAVIDRFFDELMISSLLRLDLARWPVGWRLDFNLTDVLTLVVTAGGDLERVLAKWDTADDPPAAIHMAALRYRIARKLGNICLPSAHLERHPDAAERIGAFLMRPEVGSRMETAFFAVEDPRLQKILSEAV